MTRAETIATAADLWQEVLGSATWGDPIGIDQSLSAVADELARRKKLWFDFRRVDLVAGQESYSLANTMDLRGVSLSEASGSFQILDTYSIIRAQRERRVYTGQAPGVPVLAVDAGQTLYLSPPSSVSTVGGLELLGFHNPGTFAKCLWPEDADENPLPSWCHSEVALGLAARRASLYAGSAEMMARASTLERRYEMAINRLEGEAHRQYARINGLGHRPLTKY